MLNAPLSDHRIWPRLLGEATAIVLSILLAFSIDAWWDRQIERREESRVVAALRDDFAVNVTDLTERYDVLEVRIQQLSRLRVLLESAGTCSEVQVPNELLLTLLTGSGTIDLRMGTLDAMIGAGRLDQLSDPRLRELLSSWPRLVSDVRTDQMQRRDWLYSELIPLMGQHGDYSHIFEVSPSDDLRAGSSPVACLAGIRTMVSVRRAMEQWTHQDMGPLLETTVKIADLLNARGAP